MMINPREAVRSSALYAPIRRWRLDWLTKRKNVYPDWEILLKGCEHIWQKHKHKKTGPRIAIATSLGLSFTSNTIDSLMAVALKSRGAQVELLYCDGVLPACQILDHQLVPNYSRLIEKGPQHDFCSVCTSAAERCVLPLGLTIRKFSEYITEADKVASLDFASKYSVDLNSTSEDARIVHAKAGALRFLGRAIFQPNDEAIYGRYLAAAYLSDIAASNIFKAHNYDVVVAHHGIYVPQGPIAHVVKDSGIRLVTWHPAYRNKSLIFQHDGTYHKMMISESTQAWDEIELTAEQDDELDKYLKSRETGAEDWISFQRRKPESEQALRAELGIEIDKNITLLAANVAWDACLHYPESAFGNMVDWAIETVEWFNENPDEHLIVRCHPGEVITQPAAQDRLDNALVEAFPNMPENVTIITPEMETNTYALARLSKRTVIFNTKMGMELTAFGFPVIVAGDAWIRGKGFSYDANSSESYIALLNNDKTYLPLTSEQMARARRYAYHFFFRRCIPVQALDDHGWPLVSLSSTAFKQAQPGKDLGLDIICAGIIGGKPFEYESARHS